MRRKLFNLVATASLLLCVGVCSSWVRSYWVGDQWIWSDGADRPRRVYRMGHRYVLTLTQGRVYLMHDTSWWFPPQRRYVRIDDLAVWSGLPPDGVRRSVLGFEWAAHRGVPGVSSVPMPPYLLYRIIGVPHWFLMVATAVIPCLYAVRRWRLRDRLRRGLCPTCGYDLRATPDRCPECGTSVTPSPLLNA
jgi:hypothetical protein